MDWVFCSLTIFTALIHDLGSVGGVDPVETEVNKLKDVVDRLANEVMMLQLYTDEASRSSGTSGLKQTLINRDLGTASYYGDGTTSVRVAGTYDIPFRKDALGIGSNRFVLNGVEITMAAGHYRLQMASRKSRDWLAVEDIPYPPVPPKVLNQTTLNGQQREMNLYFQAFVSQNRGKWPDIDKYFKPVLCYLEGWWSKVNPTMASQSLSSASAGRDIAYKGNLQSTAFDNISPIVLMNYNNGTPEFAQFMTRKLCHPVQGVNLNLMNLYLNDDLAERLREGKHFRNFGFTQGARFGLHQTRSLRFDTVGGFAVKDPIFLGIDILDKIMAQVPGLDNPGVNLTDDVFNLTLYKHQQGGANDVLNTGNYFRSYKMLKAGAMGTNVIMNGFSDENLWVAETSNPQVAGPDYRKCIHNGRTCTEHHSRYSYAIPLEIVWLTPLLSWNPYNLSIAHGVSPHVRANHRNGGNRPFNGTDSNTYYLTPYTLFDNAPTKHVLDQNGVVRTVVASGFQTFTPKFRNYIPVRLRYPIMPIYGKGNSVTKEVDAMKDFVMRMSEQDVYSETPIPGISQDNSDCSRRDAVYFTTMSNKNPPGAHNHEVFIMAEDYDLLRSNHTYTVQVETGESNNHIHDLTLQWNRNQYLLTVVTCDGQRRCWDGHGAVIFVRSYPNKC